MTTSQEKISEAPQNLPKLITSLEKKIKKLSPRVGEYKKNY